ncbi:MAG: hypothetical protein KGM46_12460 [Pseudomonadota bacterium]|nr:hypothetical protein [Pseudomonadota bacterium]
MTCSVRRLKRSLALRILSAMAWLMLAGTPLGAAPAAIGMVAPQGGHASTAPVASHAVDRGALASGAHGMADPSCCAGHASPGCDCPSACGNALPSVGAFLAISAAFVAVYARPPLASAPAPHRAPPWRPPVA